MLLERLKLSNFLVFEDVDLELESVKLASIIGQFVSDSRRSNGAGKTAFMEAIRYALFDQTRSKSKAGIVRTGADKSNVELQFYAAPCHIRVVRTRSATGTSSAKVWIDGQMSGDKVKVVNQVICERLGMDAELFDLIYFFKQNGQFGFAEASPGDRKNVLAKVFRMDDLAKCQQLVREKLSVARDAQQRAKGACEAAASRLSNMWSMDHYREEELAASHTLACQEQIAHDLQLLEDELNESVVEFEKERGAWHAEVDAKRNEVLKLDTMLGECANNIADKQVQRQELPSEIEQLEQRLQQVGVAKPESDEDQMVADSRRLTVEVTQAQTNATALRTKARDKKVDIAFAGADCPTCHQTVPVDHVERMVHEAAEASKKYEADADAFDADARRMQLELGKVNAEIQKWNSYNGSQRERISLKDSIARGKKMLRALDKDIDELNVRRDKLASDHADARQTVDVKKIDDTKKMLEQHYVNRKAVAVGVRTERVNYFNTSQQTSFQHGCLIKDIKARKEADKEQERANKELERADKELRVLMALSDAFGKNGIQALVIENALGVIEEFANDILKQMQTRFVINLRTQKQTKAGEDRESLDIIVFDNGNERPFENYSGGERTLVNLAIRLSLSRVISSLHGVKMQSLFLDEVLGALDEVNREEVVKVVAFLSRSFDQVLVISHTDEVKDIIDTGIVIRRHDHHSTVELTNGGI